MIALLGICFASIVGVAQEVRVHTLQGEERASHLRAISDFCNAFCREAPYFYDTSEEAWDRYISSYINQPDAVLCLLTEEETLIGVAIGTPLSSASLKYKQVFLERSSDLHSLFFMGELLVKPRYGMDRLLYEEFERQVAEKRRFSGICKWLLQDEENQVQSFIWPELGFAKTDIGFEELWKDTFGTEKVPHAMVCWKRFICR